MSRLTLKISMALLIVLLLADCKGPAQTELEPIEGVAEATAVPTPITDEGFNCTVVNEIPTAECQALVAFYEATDGVNWTDHTGWLETTTPCSWYGVTCADGHVDSLALYYNNLQGQLPALSDLPQLRVLDLHNNGLNGGIPAEIGRLSNLVDLDLSVNQLSGSLPATLGDLSNLQWLILPYNQLSGPIPAEMGKLTALHTLDLSYNQLNGAIPESLADCAALATIRLQHNQLEGSIPFGLGQLPALYEIDLSFNQLTGSAPSALFQVLTHRLWGNQLDGTIFLGENGRQNVNFLGATFTFDQSVADSVWAELVPAQLTEQPGPGMMWVPPEHIVFTFTPGEEPQEHMPLGQYVPSEAQIHIYPVAGLNEEVQPIVAALRQLLTDQPDVSIYAVTRPDLRAEQLGLTMLPPSNAVQTLRAQIQYLSFAEGQGIRYLTQLSQGPVPLSNQDVFYTFQGLTDDDATYVAAYFPVTLPALPDSGQLSEAEWATLMEDWQGYLEQTLALLNEQPPAAFTPDLATLDALINSISVAGTTAVPSLQLTWPNSEEAVDNQPILQWQALPEAVNYHVIVLADGAYPPQVIIDQTVTEPMLAVDKPLAPGHHSWTVWAQDGETAVLAELTSTFTVKDALGLVAPAVEATVDSEPLLQWQSYPDAVKYQIIILDAAAYPPVVILDQTTHDTSFMVTPALKAGSYTWTVWAFDSNDKLVAELNSSFIVANAP